MAIEPMTIIERLRNPQWDHLPGTARILHIEQTRSTMDDAANEIERLRSALGRVVDPGDVDDDDKRVRRLATLILNVSDNLKAIANEALNT
jgi:hypothetical protein